MEGVQSMVLLAIGFVAGGSIVLDITRIDGAMIEYGLKAVLYCMKSYLRMPQVFGCIR